MKTASILAIGTLLVFAALPARAQFANSAGLAPASPNALNISGAGTGLSAPASPAPAIGQPGPNAIAAPPTPAPPVQPMMPGYGIGAPGLPNGMAPGTMLPPGAVARERARQNRPR